MKKKFCFLLLTIAFLFIFRPAAFALEKAVDGYYLIATTADWNEFARAAAVASPDANARLTADIDFGEAVITDWAENYMIGKNDTSPYKGKFDGNGKTVTLHIKGVSVESRFGPFGVIESAEIKDLTVKGSVEGGDYVAGVAGYVNGSTITKCVNSAKVNGQSRLAGIAGFVAGSTITKCANSGEVSGTVQFVGGVAGQIRDHSMLTDCVNSGKVNNGNDFGGISGIGGVAGVVDEGSTLTNCVNSGEINGAKSCVGGIAGYVASTVITSCSNIGEVSGKAYVGGVAGVAYVSAVTRCSNGGKVSGATSAIGGIAGFAKEGSALTECFNSGEVNGIGNGGNFLGGIAGDVKASTLTKCFNRAEISSNSRIVGGIAGHVYGTDAKVEDCVNGGNVTLKQAKATVGGVIGYITDGGTDTGIEVKNCSSTGNITAPDGTVYIGAFVGQVIEDNSGITFSGNEWYGGTDINPKHAQGGNGGYDTGSDPAGTEAKPDKTQMTPKLLLLDSYAKKGPAFTLTVTVYPKESSSIGAITLETPNGLTLDPTSGFENGVQKMITVTERTYGTEYTVKAKCGGLFADFTVTPEEHADIETITFDKTEYTADADGYITVGTEITPSDADDKSLSLTGEGLTLAPRVITGGEKNVRIKVDGLPAGESRAIIALAQSGVSATFTVKSGSPAPSGGGSGGCTAGFAALGLLALAPLALRGKRK